MNYIKILLLSLLVSTGTYAQLDSLNPNTEDFLKALADFLFEHKTIGEKELNILITEADKGYIINPISEYAAGESCEKMATYNVLESLIKENKEERDIAPSAISTWAKIALQELNKERQERQKVKEQTKLPWKIEPTILEAGGSNTCVVKADSTAECFGDNFYGQSDKAKTSALGPVRSISAGSSHNCVVKADSTAECFGDNNYGQSAKAKTSALGPVRSISAGGFHTCVIKADRTAECFGYNYYGQSDMAKTSALGAVLSISAGGYHTCVVKADSTAECFGANSYGQSDKAKTSALGPIRSISAGDYHTCVVKADSTAECFGYNAHGQSDKAKTSALGPVRSISAGYKHTCVVKADSMAECFGDNEYGQSDNGKISALGPVLSISAGRFHTCVVKADSTAECFGRNNEKQAPREVLDKTKLKADALISTNAYGKVCFPYANSVNPDSYKSYFTDDLDRCYAKLILKTNHTQKAEKEEL